MATRQFHALEKSEAENARLKALVAEQHAQIQSLKRLVMKKQSKLLSSYRVDYPLWPYQMTNDPFTSPVMDMTMEQDLLGMLRGIDRIVADSRYPVDPRESLNVANLVATDSSEHPTIEVLISRPFPFEHKAVAGALWDIWSMQPATPIFVIASTSQTSACDVLRTLALMPSVKGSHFEPSSSAVVLLKGTEPPWRHQYSSSCWTRTGRPGMGSPCA
ncbi:hypothetical protein Poli38472_011839 [Pythium oligandrum]|uniref:Uncharacterized protein n=1 Tax=Pythium oligandrum TaxID=41045 RepID=A0A8K1C7T4_PYTOL|nr:hypothetical protein Poli38472_011839 [Pythium oligandrum]|eukprot:TMW58251.1 hypothetical protein Poli38472_011839 [Pythium oligandrum]